MGDRPNNGVAIAGTDWQTKLLITKVIDATGIATAFDIAEAIDYAVNHHARIINMSFGGYESSNLVNDAVQSAYNSNCVLVAAAGNDRTSLPFYPAAYFNVIGVSATKEREGRCPSIQIFGIFNISLHSIFSTSR
jgi:thermitase